MVYILCDFKEKIFHEVKGNGIIVFFLNFLLRYSLCIVCEAILCSIYFCEFWQIHMWQIMTNISDHHCSPYIEQFHYQILPLCHFVVNISCTPRSWKPLICMLSLSVPECHGNGNIQHIAFESSFHLTYWWISESSSSLLIIFFSFYWKIVLQCMAVPQFAYVFLSWRKFEWFAVWGDDE